MNIQKFGVYGFILNKDNKFLIIKRSKNDSYGGLWELPGGGIEFGEHPQQTVEREVKEETGLDVDALLPVSVVSHVLPNNTQQLIRIVYFCRLRGEDESVTLSHEHIDFTWVSAEEYYAEKKTQFVQQIIEDVKDHSALFSLFQKYI